MVAVLNMCSNAVRSLAFILIFSIALASCDTKEEIQVTQSVSMLPVTFQQWIHRLDEYNSKIVVVDMWAMWCVSCLERFPEMVILHKKYQDKNVEFVSMNMDDREDTESIEKAEKFLGKMNASFDHFRINENMLKAFEVFNLISIPAVVIYDPSGKERYRLTGDNPNNQFTEKDIESAILTLIQ